MTDKEESVATNLFSNEEQRSAFDAFNAFIQAQYDSCITILKKIQKSHPGDCKLMHNRAIAEFFKSGQTKAGDLKKSLSKVHKVSQQSHQEEDDLSDDSNLNEYLILHYNQALVCYFLHQYSEAQSLLEPLIEGSEPPYNINTILPLLAEVYLANYEPEKANRTIAKIEELNPKPAPLSQSKQNSSNEGKDKGKNSKSQNKESKASQSLLKVRCCLQARAMKACKRELKAFTNLETNSEISAATVQMLSVFLKSNFEFLRGNFHKAYKLLGSSPPSTAVNNSWIQNGESLLTMFYNNIGVIHFQLSKHTLGSFYLGKALEENDKAIIFNPATGSSKKESKHHHQATTASNKTLQVLNMNKKFELLYNAGIQLLFSGKPCAAFECLITAVQVFYHNPRLWLRLAECCIQACCSPDKNEVHTPSSPSRKSKYQNTATLYTVVGSGIHQKMVVHPASHSWTGTGNSVMPGPTLEFASVCLQNALTILTEAGVSALDSIETKKNSKNDPSSQNKKAEISIKCQPSGSVSGQELSKLHASILANSAFIALSLGNNLMAHKYSKTLLQLPNLSNRHRYLGKMYSAEALVSLDRISDAIQHLSSDAVTDLSDHFDSSGGKLQGNTEDGSNQTVDTPMGPATTQCCFKSVHHAQGCMLFNQAVAHSLRSEFEKAQKLLNQFAASVPQQDVPPTALLLDVYINLHTNGLQTAIKILLHNSLSSHMAANAITNSQMAFRPQQPNSMPGTKQFPSGAAISPNGTASSSGSVSGSSTGSRSKSSTPQPHYSNPPSGSVTPERVVKSSKSETSSSKTKRGRR